MPNAAAISVTLPEDLLSRVRDAATKQHSSLDDVLRIALEREMDRRLRFASMLEKTQEWGRQSGIRSEEDVERIANGEITLDNLKRPA
jgi:Arc/MetJ-type ribon-helix-helix transcriptional regulator